MSQAHTRRGPTQALGPREFIALMGMLTATIAFSIDALLPALPDIAQSLTPSNPNNAQLTITAFVLGMGIGTFFVGPLADRFGRRPTLIFGAVLYVASCMVAIFTTEITLLLITRVTMGLGASAARVVAMAIVRDQTSGREMARLMSLIMMVFALVPAIAPSIGAVIVGFTGWRGLFAAFAVFSILTSLWFLIRQPETLVQKRPLAFASLAAAFREMVSLSVVSRSIITQTLIYACLFGALSSTQQVFADVYGQVSQFPYWFALIAVLAASASFLNSKIVVKLGMQRVISTALLGQIVISAVMIAVWLLSPANSFVIYVIWTTSVFFIVGLTLGNLNALAMEPLGHIAGFAASLLQGSATVGSVLIAAPIGLAFDGTPLPVAIGITVCITLAYMTARGIRP